MNEILKLIEKKMLHIGKSIKHNYLFWISILFASILGFSRSAMIEKEAGGLVQFLSIPVDSSAVFFGKLIPNVLFLFSIQLSVYFFIIVFFRAPVSERYILLILTSSISIIGIAAVGTFFSTLSAKTNLREIFLPILT